MFATITEIIYKLWNRGIDIGVGVITSVIVACIGLIFWRVKLWLDLRADEQKQRQQHRIEGEIEAGRRRRAADERREQLRQQRDAFANTAAASTSGPEQAELWDDFLEWLQSPDLRHIPANLTILSAQGRWSRSLENSTQPNIPVNAKNMAESIRKVELPAADSSL